MQAVICPRYGPPDVLRFIEMAKPLPGPRDLLIRVVATTVSAADQRLRSLNLPRGFGLMGRLIFGITRPRQPILGSELSGVVESTGHEVTQFKPGDVVFAFRDTRLGCHAEYVTMPETGAVARVPTGVCMAEAAALSFGGTTALSFLRKAGIAKGESVLVIGASGCVGSAAVQLARHFGGHVTGLTSSVNVDLVRRIGADAVIDYTRHDITSGDQRWDVIVDTVGITPLQRLRSVLKPDGRLLLVAADLPTMLAAPVVAMTSKQKVFAGPSFGTADDIRLLAELAERGVYRPVIDKHYAFGEIVEAHRHADGGRKKGSVVVQVGSEPPR
jgi:NADPH:quinone reductase-like Zn-dependent oxidoreductase